tara:strand:+ start:7355 stop:7660 length:306 start_codon:yes stop_codon:yes gene_type:complete
MKKVQKEFVRSNFYHKQIKRVGDVAIYKRRDIKSNDFHYEVVKIGRHNGYKAGTQYIEATETYPGASLWGLQGWTYLSLEKAERNFKRVCVRFNKKKLQYA